MGSLSLCPSPCPYKIVLRFCGSSFLCGCFCCFYWGFFGGCIDLWCVFLCLVGFFAFCGLRGCFVLPPPPFFGEDEGISPDHLLWLVLAVNVVACHLNVCLGVEGFLTIRAGQPLNLDYPFREFFVNYIASLATLPL